MADFDPFDSGAVALEEPKPVSAFDPFAVGAIPDAAPKEAGYWTGFKAELGERVGQFAKGVAQIVPSTLRTISVLGQKTAGSDPYDVPVSEPARELNAAALKAYREAPPEDQPLYKFGDTIERSVNKAIPEPANPDLWHSVNRGSGQMLPMLVGGAAAKAAGAGIRGAAALATGMGAVQEFDDAFGRARDRGDDPDTAFAKSLGYASVAALIENKLGVGRLLRQYFPEPGAALAKITALGVTKKLLGNFVAGGLEEGSQRFTQNWIVDEKPSLEGVMDEALPGAIVQGIVGAPSAAAGVGERKRRLTVIQDYRKRRLVFNEENRKIDQGNRRMASDIRDGVANRIADREPIHGVDARLAGARDRLPDMGYVYDEEHDFYFFPDEVAAPAPPQAPVAPILPVNAQTKAEPVAAKQTTTPKVAEQNASLPPVKPATPALRPGDTSIKIQQPDGTAIDGVSNGKSWEIDGKQVLNVGRAVEINPGEFLWSDGPLRPGEKIVGEIPEAPKVLKPAPDILPTAEGGEVVEPNPIIEQIVDEQTRRQTGFERQLETVIADLPDEMKRQARQQMQEALASKTPEQKGLPGPSDKAVGIIARWKKRADEVASMPVFIEPKRGEIGGQLSAGEVVTTATGRQTTPFPKLTFGSDRKTGNTVRRVDAWLHENAVAEAKARGDAFNLRQFQSENPAKMPQASKDSMEQYLFGESQPPVPKPFLKPITPTPPVPVKPTARQRLTQQGGKAKPVTPVNDVPPGQSTTSVATGEKKVARGTRSRKLFDAETEAGGPDILSWIDENMRMMSKSVARATKGKDWWQLNASLFDDSAPLSAPHHNVIYGGASMPDQVAQIAYNERVLKSPDVNELWSAIITASKRRAAISKRLKHENKVLEAEVGEHEAWAKATEKGAIRVTGDQLNVGDVMDVEGERTEVVAVDPDTGDVTLQDGKKFGRQVVKEGQTIWVEKLDAAAEDVDFLEPQNREFPKHPELPREAIPGSNIFKTFHDAVEAWKQQVKTWLEGKPTNKAIVWEEAEQVYGGKPIKGNVRALTRNIGNPQKPWRITTYWNRDGVFIPSGHQEYASREAALTEDYPRPDATLHEKMPGRVMDEQEFKGYVRMDEVGDAPLFWYTIGTKPFGQIKEVAGFQNGLVIDSLWDGKIAYTRELNDAELKWSGLAPVETKPKEQPFQVDDILIWKAPGNGEDVPVNYRGPLGADKSVVVSKQSRLQLTVDTAALRRREPPPVFKVGDRVTFKPFYQREIPTTGIVQEIVNDGRGYNIFSPQPGDPSNVTRVWLEDGDIEAAKAVAPEPKFKEGDKVIVGEMGREGTISAHGPFKDGEHWYFVNTNLGRETPVREADLKSPPPPNQNPMRPLTKAEQREFQELSARLKAQRDAGGEGLTSEETRRYQELEALAGAQNLIVESTGANEAAERGEIARLRRKADELDRQAKLAHERANASNVKDVKAAIRKSAYEATKEANAIRDDANAREFKLDGNKGQKDNLMLEGGSEKVAKTVNPPEPDLFSTQSEPPPQKPLLSEDQADVIRKRMQERMRKNKPPSGPGSAALTPKPVKPKKTAEQISDDQRQFNDGVQLGALYIQQGAHKFPDWRERMLTDFGPDIEPQLRSIYETAKITIESPSGEGAAGRPAGLQPGLRPPTERIVTARAEFTKAADESIIPPELVRHLDEHQRQGAASALRSLIQRGAFLLSDGTGAGKTRQAIAVAHYFAKIGKNVIIVTKAETIKPDWSKNTFGGSYAFDSKAMGIKINLARTGVVKSGEIGITTYQNLRQVESAADSNTVLIFDESHALKNDSQQAKFGMRAARKSEKVMFMSATPADKPEHIYYLAPIGVMEGKTIQQALRDLGMTLVSVNKMVKEGAQWVKRLVTFWAEDQTVTDAERHERFSALFDRMTTQGSALKREISMDGVHVQVLRLTLPEEAHETMADILRFFDADTIDDLQGLKKASVLGHQRRQQEPFKIAPTVMLAKRELDAGRQVVIFVSRVNESEVGKWVTMTGLGGEKERIREVLMSSEGTVKTLREALHEAGIHDIAEIHGNADQNSLEAMADFQAGRKRVTIATIESGGTGINLDDIVGNRPRSMIVVTAPFDAVGNVQAAGRIWRLKTLSDARVFYLFGDTDVDQWNADIIGTKMSMLGAVVEGQVRRLNMSDPELVGTDDFHSTMRAAPKPEAAPVEPSKVPTLDWKPFKTRAGKDKFVAPATKAFWDWYNANGKGDNTLGLRPSKYQSEWQVWADQIPPSGEPSLAEPQSTGELSESIAQPVIAAWRKANPSAPEVETVNRPEWTQTGTDGKQYGVRGWWDGQKIVVNLAFVADADAVREVLEHEKIHPLLDTAQGEAAITFAITQELGGDALAKIQARYKQGAMESDEQYRRRSMAEWFAQLKESNQSLWQRIVARVREFLARFKVVELSDEEIGRTILRKLESDAGQPQSQPATANASLTKEESNERTTDSITGQPTRITGRTVSAQQADVVAADSARLRASVDGVYGQPAARETTGVHRAGIAKGILEQLAARGARVIDLNQTLGIKPADVFSREREEWISIPSTKLKAVGAGYEAAAFVAPSGDVVYKIYIPQNDGIGFFFRGGILNNGRLDASVRRGTLAEVVAKIDLLNHMGGTPTEIVGFTKEGFVVVKQPFQSRGNWSAADVETELSRMGAKPVTESLADGPEGTQANVYGVLFNGEPWLVGDFKDANLGLDTSGKVRVFDKNAAKLSWTELKQQPELEQFFRGLKDIKGTPSVSFSLTQEPVDDETKKQRTGATVIDPATGERVPDEEGGEQEVQVNSIVFTVRGTDRMTPEEKAIGVARAQDYLAQLGLPGEADKSKGTLSGAIDTNVVFTIKSDGELHDDLGEQLLAHLTDQIKQLHQPTGSPAYVAALVNAITKNYSVGNMNGVFSKSMADRLVPVAVQIRSFAGSFLRALTGIPLTMANIARNADWHLRRMYEDMFGGDLVRKIMDRIALNFRERFTGEEIERLYNSNPILQELFLKVVSRLKVKPSLREVIEEIFATPINKQDDIVDRFVDKMVNKFSATPEEAAKLKREFSRTFEVSFRTAREAAQAKALAALLPEERKTIGAGTPLWKKLTDLVNSGWFDSAKVVEEYARSKGMPIPTEAELERMRNWSIKEQALREPTLAEIEASDEPTATAKASAVTLEARQDLLRKMNTQWSRWTHPLIRNVRDIGDPVKRYNTAMAANEWLTANLLLKLGFGSRQIIDVGTSMVLHTPKRAAVYAFEQWDNDRSAGRDASLLDSLSTSITDAYRTRLKVLGDTLASFKRTLAGKGEQKNVEQLLSSIAVFDRMLLKADEMKAAGKPAAARFLHLLALTLRFGRQFAAAADVIQGVPAEAQEMAHQIRVGLREQGKGKAQQELEFNTILGLLTTARVESLTEARQILESRGLEATNTAIQRAAWHLLREKIYLAAKNAGLPADEWKAQNHYFRNVIGWNEPETGGFGNIGGPGGLVAMGAKAGKELTSKAGIPAFPFVFGNAMGIALNRKLAYTPLGLFPGIFKGSPWFEGERNIRERKIEAIIGTTIGSTLFTLAALGIWVVLPRRWPDDEKEKAKWTANGWQPGMVIIPAGDSEMKIGTRVGPMALLSPYLAAGGAMRDALNEQAKKQKVLDERAAKLGLKAEQLEGLDASQWLGVMSAAAWSSATGGRTASGMLGSYTDFGNFSAKKTSAAATSSLIPGLPGFQELSRMSGSNINPKLASFWDLLVPLPTSDANRVNLLGDPMRNENDLERIFQVLSGGSALLPASSEQFKKNKAYANLFASDYRPPAINPARGYQFGNELRPMTQSELQRYTTARGRNFSEALQAIDVNGMTPAQAKSAVQAAFEPANARALESVGATSPRASTRPLVISGGSAPRRIATPRASGRRAGLSGRLRISSGRRLSLGRRTRRLSLGSGRSRLRSPRIRLAAYRRPRQRRLRLA